MAILHSKAHEKRIAVWRLVVALILHYIYMIKQAAKQLFSFQIISFNVFGNYSIPAIYFCFLLCFIDNIMTSFYNIHIQLGIILHHFLLMM